MHSATQTVRYRSKNPMSGFSYFLLPLPSSLA